MEHQQQLMHLPPHLMLSPPGFFDVAQPLHFHDDDGGGFVEPAAAEVIDDGGWMEDLIQLGDQLFGGGNGSDNVVETAGGREAWHQQFDGAPAGSPDQRCSYDYDDDVGAPLAEHGAGELASCEPNCDDSDPSATRKRRDRSKTIVSERKRRFRMKEKLYELRALVPNITKMDKASIIADAVVYVKNLQSHAKKLKEDVAMLEARPRSPGRRKKQQDRREGQRGRAPVEGISGGGARMTNVSAAQVGEGRFFVTVECERRDGVAAPLCAALESLSCFRVESSTLGWSSDRAVSTLTLKARDLGKEVMISEGTVKLWMMAALLKEGFRPEATVAIP